MDDLSQTIANAIKTVIDGLAFTSAPSTVVVRSSDVCHTTDTRPCLVIVCTMNEESGWATTGAGGLFDQGCVGRSYTVTISLYRAFTGASQTSNDDNGLMLQQIRQALNINYLAGVDAVWFTSAQPAKAVEEGGLAKGVKKSVLTMQYGTSESTTGFDG